MTDRHANTGGFLAIYAAWVVLVNTTPGPWRSWNRGARIDTWTGTHVAFGVLAQRMGLSLAQITALGAINEVGEAWIRAHRPDLLWGEPESPPNIAVDIAANAAGWLLAAGWSQDCGPGRPGDGVASSLGLGPRRLMPTRSCRTSHHLRARSARSKTCLDIRVPCSS